VGFYFGIILGLKSWILYFKSIFFNSTRINFNNRPTIIVSELNTCLENLVKRYTIYLFIYIKESLYIREFLLSSIQDRYTRWK